MTASRREAITKILATGGAALLPAGCTGPQVSGAARRPLVIDANLLPEIDEDSYRQSLARIERFRMSGVTTLKYTMSQASSTAESIRGLIGEYKKVFEANPDALIQVTRAADIDEAYRDGKLGIILSFEHVGMLNGDVALIAEFAELGVKVMQLTYNDASPFGAGVLADPSVGLTPLGARAIEQMEESRVALDLSHSNPRTTQDAIAASKAPVLITHAGCAAVHPHPRNKDDAILKAVADRGGVTGIYDLPFLTAPPKQPDVGDYLAHIAYALKACGEDHVGIGSDSTMEPFDTSPESLAAFRKTLADRKTRGISAPEEDERLPLVEGLNRIDRYTVIADELKRRGYSSRIADKVLGLNFLRAFRDIWGG